MNPLIISKYDESCASLNSSLAPKLLNLSEEQILKQTHFFEGRYENIYVDVNQFPELQHILNQAKQYAGEILEQDPDTLKIGCWINIMYKGHTTSLHRHDEYDELLSGVYYLQVPEDPGSFIALMSNKREEIPPKEGMFLFFYPTLEHEVSEHQSSQPRISIAFNIGPISSEEDDM